MQYGFDGTGIGVAVIDSGVLSTHPDLQMSSGMQSRVVYSQSFVPNDSSTGDAYGHGTHVAGIVGGNGTASSGGNAIYTFRGIAPNANIINLRVLDGTGQGNDSAVIAAITRAIQLKAAYNIRVINLSLGRQIVESYTLDPLCQARVCAECGNPFMTKSRTAKFCPACRPRVATARSFVWTLWMSIVENAAR